ncbi:cytokine receptor common subunit gamma-like isoform X2 [Plectropomus leopardus]|uniref:cytokine receptor common subunit gamma-like isoform X2 n=1 Tax=Plectropomus leopardus TaxID=160734 RepID=UPI001C4B46B8|nr:cytokine receptor common subunit gamma-like isoform X2 [Plectropomus leopardus]
MLTTLLLLLCLAGNMFAKEPPDVDCLVMHMKYVHCSWDEQGTPEINYTFYGWFHNDKEINECPNYLSENNTNTGCNQPFDPLQRFTTFYTKLVHGHDTHQKEHLLKTKVRLNPPKNLTIKRSDLCLTWSQDYSNCMESEARYRINNSKWTTSSLSVGTRNYCINSPSCNSLVELQVRSKIGYACGESIFWSEWSEPVFWGSKISTVYPKILNSSKCELQSDILTCVCISEGFPLPTIKWPLLENHTEYCVTTTVSNHTVNSTLTLTVEDPNNTVVECVSSIDRGEAKENLTIITLDRGEGTQEKRQIQTKRTELTCH